MSRGTKARSSRHPRVDSSTGETRKLWCERAEEEPEASRSSASLGEDDTVVCDLGKVRVTHEGEKE